jgi:thiol-disulfide isomerase/thioredoxin
MRKLSRTVGSLTLAAALLLLAACDQPSGEASTSSEAGTKHESGFVLWETARAVPALAFQGGDGQPLSLDDFRGKVVVLNIWATWCPPCREEMPTLDNLQAKLGGPDLEVLTLSIDQAGSKVVRKFFEEIGIKHLRLYIDPTAQTLNILNVPGIPTTLLIDRQGRELGRLVGATEWDSPKMVQFLQGVVEQTRGDKP